MFRLQESCQKKGICNSDIASITLSDILKDTSVATDPKLMEKDKEKDNSVYICEGISPLPAKVVQLIEKGEFVEFTSLLPKSAFWEEKPFTEVT